MTEHPHVVRVPGICGGRPIVRDTRISVRYVAERYRVGDTVDEILHDHPHLQAAEVYDAISYYLDHPAEIESEINQNRPQSLMTRHGFKLADRGFVQFAGDDVPDS